MKSSSEFMRLALRLAKKAYGNTSPNPLVGAVLVKNGKVIGRGWHHQAGLPHAEIEALSNVAKLGHSARGSTLYVTLEPCCSHGRTPPCTDAIIGAGIKEVVVAATDPNPNHAGKGLQLLRNAGIKVLAGIDAKAATSLNEGFNQWIVHRTPLVIVKAAMTLDGKTATPTGESKWITGDKSREHAMKLRQGCDAILAGINTILLDDPSLTIRGLTSAKVLRRIILDPRAQIPLTAKVLSDEFASHTTIVVTSNAAKKRVSALERKARVLESPYRSGKIDLPWLLQRLGEEQVTSLLVEGGGETTAQFLEQGLAHQVAFYYAPSIIGGRDARKGVGGAGVPDVASKIELEEVRYKKLGTDLFLSARVKT